jgi:multidrug efflux pump subunit AcrA (membrane-fusion protein)
MKLIKFATTIMILCAVVFLSVGCSSKSTTTVKTTTLTAQKGTISVAITGTGNLALSRTESLAFEMAGTVAQVLVAESETVKKGQELVTLDTSAWETQLKNLEKNLVTAQRTQTTREKALTTAERAVITKETAVTTAKRQVTAREVAVSQAEIDLKTAEYNLSQIAIVKTYQDTVDNAEYALKFAKSVIAGELGGGISSDLSYWYQVKGLIETQLVQAKADLAAVLSDTGIILTTDVAL